MTDWASTLRRTGNSGRFGKEVIEAAFKILGSDIKSYNYGHIFDKTVGIGLFWRYVYKKYQLLALTTVSEFYVYLEQRLVFLISSLPN